MKKEEFWSKTAKTFDASTAYVVGEEDVKAAKEELGKQKNLGSVFEAACGTGMYTAVMLPNCDKILATDLSEDMLKVARERFQGNPKLSLEQANILELNYPKESFDTVFLGNILHVVEDHKKALKASYELLKQGGRLIALDYTLVGMTEENQEIMRKRFVESYGMPDFHPSMPQASLEEMRAVFEAEGLEVESLLSLGNSSKAIYIVGRKK